MHLKNFEKYLKAIKRQLIMEKTNDFSGNDDYGENDVQDEEIQDDPDESQYPAEDQDQDDNPQADGKMQQAEYVPEQQDSLIERTDHYFTSNNGQAYSFTSDEFGLVTCTFRMYVQGQQFIVDAIYPKGNVNVSFNLSSSKSRKMEKMSQRAFQTSFTNQYAKFKHAFEMFKSKASEEKEKNKKKDPVDLEKIRPMHIKIFKDEIKDEKLMEKVYTRNGKTYKMMKIPSFEKPGQQQTPDQGKRNFQCQLQFEDQNGKLKYMRAVVILKPANSIIAKAIVLDGTGTQIQNKFSASQVEQKYPQMYKDMKSVIFEYQKYIYKNKKLT